MKNKKKIIFFSAGAFLLSVFLIFQGHNVLAQTQQGWNPDELRQFNLPEAAVSEIITNILYWILGIFSTIAIIAFAVSGIQYLMSAGNEGMIDKAKTHMVWSIVGVIVGLSGLVIIYAVQAALGAQSGF
jgi:hypothetical protein